MAGAGAEAGGALGETVRELREAYGGGRTRSLAWRQAQLRGLLRLLKEKEAEAFQALHKDLGKHHAEAYRDEVGVLIKSANGALQQLGKWMAPDRASVYRSMEPPLSGRPATSLTPCVSVCGCVQVWVPLIAWPATAQVVPEPLGVVLIFSCWNFPLGLSLEPLIGAIAAGNAVALKPSELSPCTARFLADNIGRYIDASAVKVVNGGPEVGEQLMEHRWDKVLFTGSPRIARSVMAAAARHLTPVALELGGKCPCIFDAAAGGGRDLQVSANRIIAGKWSSCAGQACIAIDYVLVEERFAPVLIKALRSTLKRFFQDAGHMARIVNQRHFERLSGLIKDRAVAPSILHGGGVDAKNLYIEPTILLNPPLDSAIMTEEIFGPLLPIITVKKIEDSIAFVKAMPKPLAIYAFTRDAALRRRVVEETSSGSVTFNDAVVQYAIDGLPFGGVGQSGFGQYHGRHSFEMFSHKKAVMKRGYLLELMLRYPPWDESKVTLMRYLYRFNYFAFVLAFLGLRR
ncbi:aldehyde dehydrogenase family 3 member F1-like [Panicum miliaceum]|uniref:Aldehyde dehydrogenase n=1 Tax=Panicum miliaceum TaxID=4540 RepID=A0A3L6Q6V4_PANMI|nr:aldehyde dehydrogenase family 3 member F1-like [Panicum miliaceum]